MNRSLLTLRRQLSAVRSDPEKRSQLIPVGIWRCKNWDTTTGLPIFRLPLATLSYRGLQAVCAGGKRSLKCMIGLSLEKVISDASRVWLKDTPIISMALRRRIGPVSINI